MIRKPKSYFCFMFFIHLHKIQGTDNLSQPPSIVNLLNPRRPLYRGVANIYTRGTEIKSP